MVHPSINRRGDRKQTADKHPSLTVSTPQCLIFCTVKLYSFLEVLTLEDFSFSPIHAIAIHVSQACFYHSDGSSVLPCSFLSCAVSGCGAAVVAAPSNILEGQTEASGARHLMSASCIAQMKWW